MNVPERFEGGLVFNQSTLKTPWFLGCATASVADSTGDSRQAPPFGTAPTGGVNVLRKLWGEFLRTRATQVKTVNA